MNPTALDGYEILEQVGQGPSATVFRARHGATRKPVALKVFQEEAVADRDVVRALHREVVISSGLDHPNIVHVFDIGEGAGQHYIAMELVDGVPLTTLLEHYGRFDALQACRIVQRAAEGLTYAHRSGISHGSLVPENILIDPSGRVVITDFGVSRVMARARGRSQRPERVGFLAPEQAAGSPPDERSDLFSLGALLFYLLSGERPRVGTVSTPGAALPQMPRLRSLVPQLPIWLETVVARCMAADPHERLGSTSELVDELEAGMEAEEEGDEATPLPELPVQKPEEGDPGSRAEATRTGDLKLLRTKTAGGTLGMLMRNRTAPVEPESSVRNAERRLLELSFESRTRRPSRRASASRPTVSAEGRAAAAPAAPAPAPAAQAPQAPAAPPPATPDRQTPTAPPRPSPAAPAAGPQAPSVPRPAPAPPLAPTAPPAVQVTVPAGESLEGWFDDVPPKAPVQSAPTTRAAETKAPPLPPGADQDDVPTLSGGRASAPAAPPPAQAKAAQAPPAARPVLEPVRPARPAPAPPRPALQPPPPARGAVPVAPAKPALEPPRPARPDTPPAGAGGPLKPAAEPAKPVPPGPARPAAGAAAPAAPPAKPSLLPHRPATAEAVPGSQRPAKPQTPAPRAEAPARPAAESPRPAKPEAPAPRAEAPARPAAEPPRPAKPEAPAPRAEAPARPAAEPQRPAQGPPAKAPAPPARPEGQGPSRPEPPAARVAAPPVQPTQAPPAKGAAPPAPARPSLLPQRPKAGADAAPPVAAPAKPQPPQTSGSSGPATSGPPAPGRSGSPAAAASPAPAGPVAPATEKGEPGTPGGSSRPLPGKPAGEPARPAGSPFRPLTARPASTEAPPPRPGPMAPPQTESEQRPEPSKAQSARPEQAKAQPAGPEPAKAQPAKPEPARAEPPRPAAAAPPAKAEPAKAQPGGPAKADPPGGRKAETEPPSRSGASSRVSAALGGSGSATAPTSRPSASRPAAGAEAHPAGANGASANRATPARPPSPPPARKEEPARRAASAHRPVDGGTLRVATGAEAKPRRSPLLLILPLLFLLAAGGGLFLYLGTFSRGTVTLAMAREVPGATAVAARGDEEIAQAPFQAGKAELRVPLDETLSITVSAPGYKDWKSQVALKKGETPKPLPVTLAEAPGQLLVTVEAPGLKQPASIQVLRGASRISTRDTKDGKATVEVPRAAELTVKVSAPGYLEETRSITLDRAAGTGTLALKLIPDRGSLQVTLAGDRMAEARARVRVLDGKKEVAKAELTGGKGTLEDLPLGRDLVVKVSSSLHEDEQASAKLTREAPTGQVAITLELAPRLKIKTEPSAVVLVDGRKVGQADSNGALTLTQKDLAVGTKHEIEARKEGYESTIKSVTPTRGESNLALALKELPAPAYTGGGGGSGGGYSGGGGGYTGGGGGGGYTGGGGGGGYTGGGGGGGGASSGGGGGSSSGGGGGGWGGSGLTGDN